MDIHEKMEQPAHYTTHIQRSDSYFTMRESLDITASDLPVLMGVGTFNEAYKIALYRIIKFLQKEHPLYINDRLKLWLKVYKNPDGKQKEALDHGVQMEPVALELLSQYLECNIAATNLWWKEIEEDGMRFKVGASPDGLILSKNKCIFTYNDDIKALVEIKCPYSGKIDIEGPISVEHFIQIQCQLWITGVLRAYYAIYTKDKMVVRNVSYSEYFIREHVKPEIVSFLKKYQELKRKIAEMIERTEEIDIFDMVYKSIPILTYPELISRKEDYQYYQNGNVAQHSIIIFKNT